MKRSLQPLEAERVFITEQNGFGIYAGSRLHISPTAQIADGDLIAIETGTGFYLRRYDVFCRNLKILGKVTAITRLL